MLNSELTWALIDQASFLSFVFIAFFLSKPLGNVKNVQKISNKFTIFKETQIRGLFFNYIRNMSDANFSTPVPIIVDLFNVDDTSVAKKWCGTFFEANWMDASKYLAL